MSHVMGKNREELLAMARGHGEATKGLPAGGELLVKEDSPFATRIKIDGSSSINASTGAGKRTSSIVQNDKGGDEIKIEDSHSDRSFGDCFQGPSFYSSFSSVSFHLCWFYSICIIQYVPVLNFYCGTHDTYITDYFYYDHYLV